MYRQIFISEECAVQVYLPKDLPPLGRGVPEIVRDRGEPG